MSLWSSYRLIDMMSQIDLSFLEEIALESDLDRLELSSETKRKWSGKRIAMLSGLAASSVALTGMIVFVCKKHDIFRRTA